MDQLAKESELMHEENKEKSKMLTNQASLGKKISNSQLAVSKLTNEKEKLEDTIKKLKEDVKEYKSKNREHIKKYSEMEKSVRFLSDVMLTFAVFKFLFFVFSSKTKSLA